MTPRIRQSLRVLLAILGFLVLSGIAVTLLLPRVVEGLARREIERVSGRFPGTFEAAGFSMPGSTRVAIDRATWREGPDFEAILEGVTVDVDPFGFLVGGRKVDRVGADSLTVRLGSPDAPLSGPSAAWSRLRGLARRDPGGAVPPSDRGSSPAFRSSRLPDVSVRTLSATVFLGHRVVRFRDGRMDLFPDRDASVQARRILEWEAVLDPGDGLVRRVRGELVLGASALEKASLGINPSVQIPGPWGTLSADSATWLPGEVSLLGPVLSQPGHWTVGAERVSVRWDEGGGPAPQVLLDLLPRSATDLARRLMTGRTVRAIEVQRPSIDVVMTEPPPPVRPPPAVANGIPPAESPRSPASKASPPAASTRSAAVSAGPPAVQVRLVAAFQSAEALLSALGGNLARASQALPEARLWIHGASVRTLEPGLTVARPGQSLVNLDARVERVASGSIEASLRFECPEAPANANEARVALDPATGDLKASLKASYLPIHAFRALAPRWLRTRDAILRQTDGSLSLSSSSRRIEGSGTASVSGLVLDLPAVSSAPMTLSEASMTGSLVFDWGTGRLDFDGGLASLGRVQVPFQLHASQLSSRPRFGMKGSVERVAAQEVVRALPREVLGSLENARLSGTFAATFELDVDTANLDAVRVDIRPDVADVTTVSLGDSIDLDLLRSVFMHRIEESDGTVVDRMVGEATPEWVPLSEVPKYLVDALTTAEDATFFKHKGFSPVGIRRSVKVNLERGGFYQGASTLSQQLVKNLFLSREKTLSRKLQEVFLTWQMEQVLPKEKILELYLNVIEWGPNTWGLREAAGHYFAKRPSELSPLEAAYLVSIVPSPRAYHKHIEDGAVPPSFERRVKSLLEEMERRKLIPGEEVAAALEQHVRFVVVQPPSGDPADEEEPPAEEFDGE